MVPEFNLQYSFLAHYHEQLLTQTSSTALATLNMVSPNNWAKNRSLKKERVRNGLTSLRWWCMSNLTFRETGAGHSKKHFVWLTKVKVRRLALLYLKLKCVITAPQASPDPRASDKYNESTDLSKQLFQPNNRIIYCIQQYKSAIICST